MASHQARAVAGPRPDLLSGYARVRQQTEALCGTLEIEDYVLQSMPDASPVKWHLAHTSWFFETFVLREHAPGYREFHPEFGFLFNSYYQAIGSRWPRPQRGLLSRPSVADVYRYRAHVDEHIDALLRDLDPGSQLAAIVELGLNHEEQHQELILTDIKHAFAMNPLQPVFRKATTPKGASPKLQWISFSAGLAMIGHNGARFAFDNETPPHQVYLQGFEIASRPVTNKEYLEFMKDDGYARAELWLSDGWAVKTTNDWQAPLYWSKQGDEWTTFTLAGPRPLNPSEPVCHLSYYEADAFARWSEARLPTEMEWERATQEAGQGGHYLESEIFHPAAGTADDDSVPLVKLFGDIWQWTASAYVPYPGYRAAPGALGEYNGKFMCNQIVLRGASCVTPRAHARPTYRNFFPPEARWQFTGLRLAKDLK
jgi:ergothioneine biosynthesis protein EgtB